MSYFLIIMMIGVSSGSADALTTVEFSTSQPCESAAKDINMRKYPYTDVIAFCEHK
jgi:hypothetical protein